MNLSAATGFQAVLELTPLRREQSVVSREWQQAIKALEAKLAIQEEGIKQQLEITAEQAKVAARQELLSKPWWKVTFERLQ